VFTANLMQDNLAASPIAFPYAPQLPSQPRAFGTPSTNSSGRYDRTVSEATPRRQLDGRRT